MERGLYEQLVTQDLNQRLAALEGEQARTHGRRADSLTSAPHVEPSIHRVLFATKDPERRLSTVNELLGTLEHASDPLSDPTR